MAKVKGPLMSVRASGLIGERLVFSHRKTGQQARIQKAQVPDYLSFGQADNKSLYRLIIARWNSFSDAEREVYNQETTDKNLHISGWNLFLKRAMADPFTYIGLCGYWSMNRTGFGTVLDLSKNGHVGTLYPSWPSNAPQYVDSKNVKAFKALSFDGIDDYVDIGDQDIFDFAKGDFSISGLFRIASGDTNSFCPILGKGEPLSATLGNGYEFVNDDRDVVRLIRVGICDGVDYRIITVDNTPYKDDLWHQFVVSNIYDTEARLYIDGVSAGSSATVFSGDVSNAHNLRIGRRSIGSSYFLGSIDEVRIWNRGLLAGEVLDIYNMFK